jgi:hypothetical protein
MSRRDHESIEKKVKRSPVDPGNILIPYNPEAVGKYVRAMNLPPVEIAARSNGAFSYQWLYSLLAGDYPRARRLQLLALANTLGTSLSSLTHR